MPSWPHRSGIGEVDTRPRVGFSPKRPHDADGMRIEPPPSPPMPTATIPAATATAVPPDEPPGVRVGSQGLRVRPNRSDSVKGNSPNSGMFVRPTITAPAARSRSATAPSRAETTSFARPPYVVTVPATSFSSLIATGTPCSGPRSSPRARAPSRAAASARAPSARTTVKALSVGSTASMRLSTLSRRSAAETSPAASAPAWPSTPPHSRSSGRR